MIAYLTETTFAGNELWRFSAFCGVLLICLIGGRLVRFFFDRAIVRRAARGTEWLEVLSKALARPILLVTFALGVGIGMKLLVLSEGLGSIAGVVTKVLTAAAVGYVIYSLVDIVDYYLTRTAEKTESKVDDVLAPLVGKSVRVTVFMVVLLNVAHVVSGKNITTILAGLGVGGLAIALAGQDTIKNFFGSIVILGDRPFEIGDRIKVDGHDGPVESVGFRSTRVRTLDGHLVTVPNSEMVNRTVQNIGSRPYIKRVMNITVTYDTRPAKMQRAIEILKELLDKHDGMDPEFPPRVFFSDFNDCSLNILVIYWYHPPEYWDYMAFSERLNMQILERFNAEGIDFAFPSKTLYMANDDKRQLAIRMLSDADKGQ